MQTKVEINCPFLLSSLPLLGAVVQSYGQGEERVFQSVGGAVLIEDHRLRH